MNLRLVRVLIRFRCGHPRLRLRFPRGIVQNSWQSSILFYHRNVGYTSLYGLAVKFAQVWPPLSGVLVAGEDDGLGLPPDMSALD